MPIEDLRRVVAHADNPVELQRALDALALQQHRLYKLFKQLEAEDELNTMAIQNAGDVRIGGGEIACSKLGLSVDPVAQQAHIADPAGGGTQDTQARLAIVAILAVLETFGFTATS